MKPDTAKFMAGVCAVVGFSLGVVPLVQWFLLDHASGLIARIFRDPSGAWIWGWPVIVVSLCVVGFFVFGHLSERDAPPRREEPERTEPQGA